MLAASFHVSGAHGVLVLIAGIIFVIAAVIAWLAPERLHRAISAAAAGLAVYMLSLLWT